LASVAADWVSVHEMFKCVCWLDPEHPPSETASSLGAGVKAALTSGSGPLGTLSAISAHDPPAAAVVARATLDAATSIRGQRPPILSRGGRRRE
jgi:hypothetical protein